MFRPFVAVNVKPILKSDVITLFSNASFFTQNGTTHVVLNI